MLSRRRREILCRLPATVDELAAAHNARPVTLRRLLSRMTAERQVTWTRRRLAPGGPLVVIYDVTERGHRAWMALDEPARRIPEEGRARRMIRAIADGVTASDYRDRFGVPLKASLDDLRADGHGAELDAAMRVRERARVAPSARAVGSDGAA